MKLLQLLFLSLLWSCGVDNNKPTVVYTGDSTAQELLVDSTLIITSELPIHFDFTDYLLFPIGPIQGYGRSSKIYLGSGSSGDDSFAIGYISGTTYNGQLDNIKIQHVDSTNFKPLTDQKIKLRSFQFLESIRKETGMQLLVIEATDRDTNNDGKLTTDDVESLYMAHLNGTGFRKLTLDNHELLDWRVVTINKRLYFRTVEDVNTDGEFDSDDNVHHYFTNLEREFEVVEYNPLENF
ncbi:MAG: hypothetical protein WAU36_02985 [Cyclobacteriaceae bacterium]